MRRIPNLASLPAFPTRSAKASAPSPKLSALADFGHNPGALGAKIYAPQTLAAGAALVVVLHGCTQTAEGYDFGSGWSALADEYGVALLYPEQRRANNPNLCFNWFLPQDSRRDRGEALSIRNMIATMVEKYQLDPNRIYITGLSAGGAMANVMLATYPEIFAGGAIIAGLPYGTATDVPQALERMRGHGLPEERDLASLVRRATDFEGEWPTISVWHGSSDATVSVVNADAILTQWRSVHGLSMAPTRSDSVDGYPRQVWCDAQGRECIESFTIAGMAHGTPLATQGPDACGSAGPYMLDKNISSTRHIARFWGLAHERAVHIGSESDNALPSVHSAALSSRNTSLISSSIVPQTPAKNVPLGTSGIGKVIDDALRAAGLLR